MSERNLTALLRTTPKSQSLWDRWFRAIYPRVYYSLFRITGGDASTAQDLTQGAMERFIRYAGLDRVATDDESVAYLIASGRRLFADEIASQSPTIPVREVKGASEEGNEAIEELMDIEAVMEKLDADERSLMTFHLAGLSISEVADKLDISYAAAGQRLSRTREKMKNLVKKSVKSRFIGQRKARK